MDGYNIQLEQIDLSSKKFSFIIWPSAYQSGFTLVNYNFGKISILNLFWCSQIIFNTLGPFRKCENKP